MRELTERVPQLEPALRGALRIVVRHYRPGAIPGRGWGVSSLAVAFGASPSGERGLAGGDADRLRNMVAKDSGLGRPQVRRQGFPAPMDRLGRVFALRSPLGLRVAGLPWNCYS